MWVNQVSSMLRDNVRRLAQLETMDEKELEKIRYEVVKLGMTGFPREEREDAHVALAIKLGAKPPKNKVLYNIGIRALKNLFY